MEKKCCGWCRDNELLREYHDNEWGVPVHSDQKHFEFLMMEVMQCGLNWLMMLKRREVFRQCFDNFDYRLIANYTEEKRDEILSVPEMIHSRRKIEAIIHNASAFLGVIEEFGSFDNYIWSFTDNTSIAYKKYDVMQSKNVLSDRISKDLKKRGFKYMGSITIYAHLQASGIINDHERYCFRYEQLINEYPIRFIE